MRTIHDATLPGNSGIRSVILEKTVNVFDASDMLISRPGTSSGPVHELVQSQKAERQSFSPSIAQGSITSPPSLHDSISPEGEPSPISTNMDTCLSRDGAVNALGRLILKRGPYGLPFDVQEEVKKLKAILGENDGLTFVYPALTTDYRGGTNTLRPSAAKIHAR